MTRKKTTIGKPTIEDLLLPRYEVLTSHPDSDFYEGQILLGEKNGEVKVTKDTHIAIYKPAMYPKVFRPMKWCERRKLEQMPEFVKFNRDYMEYKKGSVYPFVNYGAWFKDGYIGIKIGKTNQALAGIPATYNVLEPATRNEFIDYWNKQAKNPFKKQPV